MASVDTALRASAQRYRENLFESVLPFWMRHSIDNEYGGFFTCLDRDGSVFDTRKYVWLNGRQVWTLSRLYNSVEPRDEWLEAARGGVEFLRRNVYDAKGRCYFSLTREGRPVFQQRKPYGAVFVMLGLLEYSKAANDAECLAEAISLYHRVRSWIAQPSLLDRPALDGAPAMTQLADIYVLASMSLDLYRQTRDPQFLTPMSECLTQVLSHYDPATRLLTENAGPQLRQFPEGRLVCTGSIFEIAWFLFDILAIQPNPALQKQILGCVESAFNFGWDSVYGGLYYFQDLEGKPLLQLESSMKLWWVHAEALYCLIYAYTLTGEGKWLQMHAQVEDYIFRHFVDSEQGEWFGYLDRQGIPTHFLKGNNYKGCFHIPRALLLSFQRIEQSPAADHQHSSARE